MFGLFTPKPVLDEGTTLWLFDAYAWALENFERDLFARETRLITPSDQDFPDKVASPEQMLLKVFDRVRGYAGMLAWPCELIPAFDGVAAPSVQPTQVSGALRGPDCVVTVQEAGRGLPIRFDPQYIGSPPVLIASFAQALAGYLGAACPVPPPGGEDNRAHANDLLAVFMGFGLFLANHAFTITRGGCSGCGVSASCLGALTEEEFVYALAIFATLKGLAEKQVEPQLKSQLRGCFRKAMKELKTQRADEMARLQRLGSEG